MLIIQQTWNEPDPVPDTALARERVVRGVKFPTSWS